MMNSKQYKRIIEADFYRYAGKRITFKGFLKLFFFNRGYRFIYIMRRTAQYREVFFFGLFLRTILRYLQHKYQIQISARTKIGEGFCFGHYGVIVVSHNVEMGDYCSVTHGVTIGEASRGKRKGAPVLGNRVWVGTNAIIVGKVTIGDNSMIAPGAFVNFDVPENSIVIGNPGKIIYKENASAGYVKRILPK